LISITKISLDGGHRACTEESAASGSRHGCDQSSRHSGVYRASSFRSWRPRKLAIYAALGVRLVAGGGGQTGRARHGRGRPASTRPAGRMPARGSSSYWGACQLMGLNRCNSSNGEEDSGRASHLLRLNQALLIELIKMAIHGCGLTGVSRGDEITQSGRTDTSKIKFAKML
jgi:hypothetical protein